jgi:hypothetical protein
MSADRGRHQPALSRRVRTDCPEIRRRHCAHQGRIQHLEFWARRPSPDRSRSKRAANQGLLYITSPRENTFCSRYWGERGLLRSTPTRKPSGT